MKSQKGITMMSLIIYVACFVAVTTIVAGITTFFYSNMQVMDTNIGSNSTYNKFNLYLLNECKKAGVSLYAWKDASSSTAEIERLSNPTALPTNNSFITFLNTDGTKNSFIYDNEKDNLYYNSIKLCENVEDFQVKIDKSTGKDVLSVLINIDGTAFRTKYVIGS